MVIQYTQDYQDLSKVGAEILLRSVKSRNRSTICVATGGSPTGLYAEFVRRAREERVEADALTIVKLDEWYGLEKEDPSTCEHYVRRHLLEPLRISSYISFDPKAQDGPRECQRIEGLIERSGGIDLCILGLGKNGHLGLNEPQGTLSPSAHVAVLDERTKGHTMLRGQKTAVDKGLTLGLKNLLDSREILLLVTGEGKQDALGQLLLGKVSTSCPASFLWLHNQVTCLVDSSILAAP